MKFFKRGATVIPGATPIPESRVSIIISKDLFQTNIYPAPASWQIKRKAKVVTPLVMVNVWILVQGTETNYDNLRIKKGVEKLSETK